MGAYGNLDSLLPGLQGEGDSRVRTLPAAEDIGFGAPIFGYTGVHKAYHAHQDVVLFTLDADLIASNSTVLKINGTALGAVVYATSHDNTMDLLKAAIEAAYTGATVTLPDATHNRQIRVQQNGYDFSSCSGVVSGGVSQAGITCSYGTDGIFLGVSVRTAVRYPATGYESYDPVNVQVEGLIGVPAAAAVNENNPAYVVLTPGASQGKFSTSGYAVNGKYAGTLGTAGNVLVDLKGSYDDANQI